MRRRKPDIPFAAPKVYKPMADCTYGAMVARAKIARKAVKRKPKEKRSYSPVMRRVVEHKEDQSHRGMLMPGRWGKRWEYWLSDLNERAVYDPDMRIALRNIPKLVDKMCPFLNGERRARVIKRITSIAHAKQREWEKYDVPQLVTRQDRLEARRKLKGELKRERQRTERRNALKELKALLAKKA